MERRRLLRIGGVVASLGLTGCSGDGSGGATARTTTGRVTATREVTRGIYVQSFVERMHVVGTAAVGPYEVGLLFTVPHVFWTVTGTDVSRVPTDADDAVHLMALVWDPETGTVLPGTGLSVEITRAGELVSEEVIYPMLSQRMGFHYGGNFPLPADGTYTLRVSVGGLSVRRTGAFAGRFGGGASAELPLEFTAGTRADVSTRAVDAAGQRGAVATMEMGMPVGLAPEPDALPGSHLGTARSDGACFVLTRLDSPPAGVDGDDADGSQYLAASARTRYNGLVLPAMAVSGRIERDGETVIEGDLVRTLDPDLGYHYGATVPELRDGDRLTLSVDTPPQVARHEGYETAFLDMPEATLRLDG